MGVDVHAGVRALQRISISTFLALCISRPRSLTSSSTRSTTLQCASYIELVLSIEGIAPFDRSFDSTDLKD